MNNPIKYILTNKKIILINLLVLSFFALIPPVSLMGYRSLKLIDKKLKLIKNQALDQRANYPLYPDKEFSNKLYIITQKLENKYRSFLGWRYLPFNSKLINIKGIYRTRLSSGESLNDSTWFFGGSTMWGDGVSDNGTIPSLYHEKTGDKVFNFGENSWVSFQSLNQLIIAFGDGYRPKKVIFYDGVNDVFNSCRIENKILPIHSRELLISNAIDKLDNPNLILKDFFLEPYILIKNKFGRKSLLKKSFDCHSNKEKVQKIAKHLINNWYSAYKLSKANNAKFFAILQPNIFTSGNDIEDFFTETEKNRINILRKEYEIVYKEILMNIKRKCQLDNEFCESFINGSNWIRPNSKVFLDFCHLTKDGNSIIADMIISKIEK